MKLIAVLLALNVLAAVQLVTADCQPEEVIEACLDNLKAQLNNCGDNEVCKCERYNGLVSCYGGCNDAENTGKRELQKSFIPSNCAELLSSFTSSASAKPTSSATSSYPSSTSAADSKDNAAANNIDGSMFSNSLLAGVAAVAGVVAYYI